MELEWAWGEKLEVASRGLEAVFGRVGRVCWRRVVRRKWIAVVVWRE